MRVDGRDNSFDHHGIDRLLKGVVLLVVLLVLPELEDLVPLGVSLNFRIEELGPFDAPAFEVLDTGGETYFGLGEQEREETVLSPPFDGRKMAHECRKLVNEVSNRVEGGLSHDFVKWDCFHPSPDHLSYGGHCCRDCRHDRAVLALTTIT